MRPLLVFLCTIFSLLALGQKPFLKKADFAEEQLSESWIIVKIEPGTTLKLDEDTEVEIFRHSSTSKKSILDGMRKIKLKSGQDPIDFCNKLILQKNVIYAEPIIKEQPLYVPSDPNASNQSYLTRIKAYEAWDVTRGDDDITIGIIDTGIALDHEDLADNIWINSDDPIDGIDNDENGYIDDYIGYDFADSDNDPNADLSGHGAEVAGIASASTDNGIGISGIGFNTKVAALKGFKSSNNSSNGLYEAIIYAVDNGMEILNLSWGSPKIPLQSEQDIINYAVLENDVVVIAAAGNDGGKENPEAKFYPASYDHVLSIGATDNEDHRWSLSTYNHSVDLMAPGSSIYSTRLDNTYASGFGTSLSSPMVSGAAALVRDEFPNLNARQIMERIRVSADDIYDIGDNVSFDGKLGKGRLNIFRAVAETGLKSLRLEDIDLATSIGNQFFFGDTVNISGSIINYLAKINSPLLTLSSDDLGFTATSLYPGILQTMQEKAFDFQVIIPSTTPPDSKVKVRVDMMDGSYNDFQFIEFTTAPDHTDFGNENISMTIAGNGNLGYAGESFQDGIGFQSQFGKLLDHVGFMIASSADSVSDNFIQNYSTGMRSQDFINQKNFKLSYHPGADFYGYSEFKDTLHNIVVEQSSLAWKDEDFIILRYRIINTSSETRSNTLVGLYTDWNLDATTRNRSEYNSEKKYILTTNETTDQFTATQVIGNGEVHYSNLDLASFNGNEADISDEFTDEMKYDFLTVNQFLSAGNEGLGNNVASLIALSIDELAPHESEYINVILAANTSLLSVENTLISAQEKLAYFESSPKVLETFRICDVNQISIDPSSGTTFEFYEGSAGENLITTGSIFQPAGITSDTIFYVRNIDDAYPTDFFQLKLQLFSDISNFKMSTDTLYLDDSNIVSFTDTSLDAISWSWNFGQGTTTSIQNPSISFNQEGTYQITLTVTNAIGCEDTRLKNLVVAARPPAPVFEDFLICPNETVSLTDPDADKLKVYATSESNNPISGINVEIGPFSFESIVYVSGIYNGFESSKTAVSIGVYNVDAGIKIEQDTTGAAFKLQLKALIANESTAQWFVDDVDFGDESTILIDAIEGQTNVRLEVESSDGCIVTTSKNIQISSSPTPIQKSISKCSDQSTIIRPENGTYFGFYSDDSLTELIKKGTQLEITDQEKIYIVGLDDGLPSQAIEVTVSNILFDVSIQHTSEQVASKNKVSLSANSENAIYSYQWFVDGELSEIASNPSLFLENDLYEIVLQATSSEGCTTTDTLNLDFREVVLGNKSISDFQVFPNPSKGLIYFIAPKPVQSLSIHNLSGQLLKKIDHPGQELDINFLEAGFYVIRTTISGQVFESSIILKK